MLRIFTLAFEAEPFIERHLPIFEKLTIDWRWVIVHGPSSNGGSTKWCQPQRAGLSTDGTTEFLRSIRKQSRLSGSDRVTVIEKKLWESKDEMCHAALASFSSPGVLFQIDSDEIWTAAQIETIVRLFAERPQLSSIMFPCRYFVGERLILRGENCYGDYPYEWLRAWRWDGKSRFISHEPPVLHGDDPGRRMSKNEARVLGLVFDHFAYATEAQCDLKERFYGYRGLMNQWRALQRHRQFPVALSRFFSHVKGPLPEVVKI